MPPILIAAAVTSAVVAGSTFMSINQQKKAAKEAKKANRFERQKAELQSARQKIEAVREGRRAMAEVQQNSQNQGVSGSSIGQGGAGSVFSQTNANLSFLDRYGYYSDQASKHLQRSANAQGKAGMWGQVGQAAQTVFSTGASVGAFTGPKPPAPKQG